VLLLTGGMGQVNYMTTGVHARLSAANRADHYSGCVALMWDAVGEVGAASCLDVEASRADQPLRAPIKGTRQIL
jgi:hypothetical protein